MKEIIYITVVLVLSITIIANSQTHKEDVKKFQEEMTQLQEHAVVNGCAEYDSGGEFQLVSLEDED